MRGLSYTSESDVYRRQILTYMTVPGVKGLSFIDNVSLYLEMSIEIAVIVGCLIYN